MAIDTSTRPIKAKEFLLDYINKNQLGQGDQLPSEAEMARTLGVSRNTIREAYITLEAEGTIVRKHGIGTFVSRSPMIKEALLDELTGFPSHIKSAGYTFDFKVISNKHVIATDEVCRALQGKGDEEVLQFQYVQFADGAPALYLIDHFAAWIDESKFDWDKFEGQMLEFVSDSFNMPERHFYTRILAAVAEGEISDHLAIPPGTPVVQVKSTITTLDGRPTTYSMAYLNPERIEFELARVYRQRKSFTG